ncbi:C40 family peptidase [Pedobacter agri]|uniref:C40 family peptidase n=1 Tax=Pedobacter agri TaxID=454586 RepID=UPI00292FF911|nr:SH3 domain-containing C40 family peptidase [Pedobacter agri]
MKKLGIFTLLLTVATALKAQVDTTAIYEIANAVKKEFAPDKRSVYFGFHFKGDTIFVESSSEKALEVFNAKTKTLTGMVKVSKSLPSQLLNGMEYGLANLSVCNNRAAPQNAAEMMTQMTLGTPVEVLKKQGGYYLVRTPDGYLSYTDGAAVSLMNRETLEKWKKAKRIIYLADYGHAYSKAEETSMRVSDLVKGNILEVSAEDKKFYKVIFPDRRIGFVKKTDATLFADWRKQVNPNAESVLATAKTLMGVPYLWGGTSIKGVDCSGFTKTSYFLNGVVIPRDASQQALIGENIDVLENDSTSLEKCLKNLKAGDLLFFSAAKIRGIANGKVTHTAIYMGAGTFIQSAGMVRINSLDPKASNFDEREFKTLVSARRILNQIGQPEITRVDQHDWYGK